MEKAKISGYQLFVLIILFEIGSAQLVPLGIDAKQDAWLVILIAMLGGCLLFLVYYALYQYYPDKLLTESVREILGNFLGSIVAFFYILYFVYIGALVLRDFGETLLTFAYPLVPLFFANAVLILVVVYAVRKGIEVMGRTGELLFVIEFILAIGFILLVVISGLIHFSNLKPVLEVGGLEVMKTAFTKTIFFPFGEIVVFLMVFPYLDRPNKLMKVGVGGLLISGLFLAFTMAVNIAVLGVDYTSRSQYPLLTLIQSIELGGFIERLDIYFLVELMIGGFFKLGLFLYAAVTGASNLFKIKEPSRLTYPIGMVILLLSIMIAGSYAEHTQEGFSLAPMYLHFPFQVIIPFILLIVAFFRNKKKSKTASQ